MVHLSPSEKVYLKGFEKEPTNLKETARDAMKAFLKAKVLVAVSAK